MPFLPRSVNRLLAGASLVLLAAALPGKAKAECGDYVMVGGKHAAAAAKADPGQKPVAPSPCQGPHCSQRSNLPLVPPAPPPSISAGEWACLNTGGMSDSPCRQHICLEDSSVHPIQFSESVFHPPRLDS
jgi:hypothetical protein